MLRITGLIAVLLTAVAIASDARASDTPDASAEAAAEAAFVALLPDRNVAGECSVMQAPDPNSVCYRWAPGRSTASFSIYSAHTVTTSEEAWWAGVMETDGGWKSYDAGRCDLVYCRMTAPGDVLLLGFPGGDANCDGVTDSRDALLVLQVIAAVIAEGAVPCIADANVDPSGELSSLDALAILQSDAGLLSVLPLPVR